MFNIPEQTLLQWEKEDKPKATSEDIERLQKYIKSVLPDLDVQLSKPYLEFITRYGFVVFNHPLLDSFWYEYSEGGQKARFPGPVSYFKNVDKIILSHSIMTGRKHEDDDKFIPDFMLPIASGNDQDIILLELGGQHDRIFYWEDNFDPWGIGSNTRLGFVADNMYDFINNLEEWPEE